jgi:hypothetical protein
MVIIPALLCLVTLFKLVSIANAIRWLSVDGDGYRLDVAKSRPQTVLALEVALELSHAGFFPFGLKDYRLGRVMRRLPRNSVLARVAWWGLAGFQKVLFQFQGLALVSAAFLVLGARAPASATWVPRHLYGELGTVLGILLMIGIILLAVESFVSYVVLGSYGVAFHHLNWHRRHMLDESANPAALLPQSTGKNSAIVEMVAYAGIFITGFVIMTGLTYFTSLQLGGFSAIPNSHSSGLIDARRLFDALYATVNIAGGSSDGNPDHVAAMLIGMIGTITYLLLTVIVLAGLAGIAIRAPENPG